MRLFGSYDIFIDNLDNWTEEMTVAVIEKGVLPRDEINIEQNVPAQSWKVRSQGNRFL